MKIYAFLILLLASVSTFAKSTYVAENISTPLYATPGGPNNKISNWLLPGTKVKILKKGPKNKYVLIEWSKGKTGWIQARKLTQVKPALARLKIAKYQMDALRKKVKVLEARVNAKGDSSASKPVQVASNQLDSALFKKMNNTISSQAQSIAKLQTAIEKLTAQNQNLSKQIAATTKAIKTPGGRVSNASGTQVDWFMWGGFVVALSFISGILITKIRWRKDRIFS